MVANALDRMDKTADLIPPKNQNSQISEKVNDAIIKGMGLYPEERSQKMQEWLDLLGVPVNGPNLPDDASQAPKNLWWKIIHI